MEKTEQKGIIAKVYNWLNNLTIKGLLSITIMAFIIIIIILSVSFLPNALSKISSSFSTAMYSIFVPGESATMTIDKKIISSGEEATIKFKKGDLTNGLFAIAYTCDANISLVSIETNGEKNIECDKAYYLVDNDTSIKIKPTTQDSLVRINIEGVFESNESQKIDKVGLVRLIIKNTSTGINSKPTTPTTNNTANNISAPVNNTYLPNTYQPTYYGKPDLATRILQVGLLSGNTVINNQTQFSTNDTVGIKFEVRNDGDADTGPWSFTATLPSISSPYYNSGTQISLKPGDSIIFTLGFGNLINQYNNNILINADPLNLITESNDSNNTAYYPITNIGYNNYYNNNYYNYNNDWNGWGNNNYNYPNNGCYINGVFTYNCYNNYYYNNNLSVNCYSEPVAGMIHKGDRVRWYAEATGGDYSNYHFEWSGTEGLSTTSQNPSKYYYSTGTKYATVTVTSNGYSISRTCSVYID